MNNQDAVKSDADYSKATEEKTQSIQSDKKEIADDKAQIIWNGNTLIVVLPCDKINRTFARGILLDAGDHVQAKYMQLEADRQKIIKPGNGGRAGMIGRLFK